MWMGNLLGVAIGVHGAGAVNFSPDVGHSPGGVWVNDLPSHPPRRSPAPRIFPGAPPPAWLEFIRLHGRMASGFARGNPDM
jgi:hypothetical protein